MDSITIPTDYAWSTWTLTNVTNNTADIVAAVDGGTAVSPGAGYDAGSGNYWYVLSWSGGEQKQVAVQARTATTSAALSSASYFTVYNDTAIPIGYRNRFIQVKATFTLSGVEYVSISDMTLTYVENANVNQYDNAGLTQSLIGSRPTKDGKFKGRKYTCAVCGLSGRKPEMIKQRGHLVHRDTCYDEDFRLRRRKLK